VCLFYVDVDIQHQHFGGRPGSLAMFGFPLSAIFASIGQHPA
jgi:hypothetical protein